MNDTVILIAKGPSAIKANDILSSRSNIDIACVNDSINILDPIRQVEYVFFTHSYFINKHIKEKCSYVKKFVSPISSVDMKCYNVSERRIYYKEDRCKGDNESISKMILDGGIIHHNTSLAAHHWLAKHGKYKNIIICGVDGGKYDSYASNVSVQDGPESSKRKEFWNVMKKDLFFFDKWKEIHKRASTIIDSVYGTKTEWIEN